MSNFDLLINKIPSEDLWQYLKASKLPIVLYGMGDGADKIINVLKSYDIKISDIFASDEFVRGHSFQGFKVKKYSEICSNYDKANILLCFAAHTVELYNRFDEISAKFNFFAPDVPVTGEGLFTLDYFNFYKNEIKIAYESLEDESSKKVFENIILYKLTGKIQYLKSADSDKESAFCDILKLSSDENFLDLGAYNGDTVKEFTEVTNSSYNQILAVEPDLRSYNKLQNYLNTVVNARALNCGISNIDTELMFSNKAGRMSAIGQKKGVLTKIYKIDTLCKSEKFVPTYIKMDLEGEEEAALNGAVDTLQTQPKLLVSAYHRTQDLFSLINLIHTINKNYKIYLRKHSYIPAWDINIYAI